MIEINKILTKLLYGTNCRFDIKNDYNKHAEYLNSFINYIFFLTILYFI